MRSYKQEYIVHIRNTSRKENLEQHFRFWYRESKVSPDMRFNHKISFSLPVCTAFALVEELCILMNYLSIIDTPTMRDVRNGFDVAVDGLLEVLLCSCGKNPEASSFTIKKNILLPFWGFQCFSKNSC